MSGSCNFPVYPFFVPLCFLFTFFFSVTLCFLFTFFFVMFHFLLPFFFSLTFHFFFPFHFLLSFHFLASLRVSVISVTLYAGSSCCTQRRTTFYSYRHATLSSSYSLQFQHFYTHPVYFQQTSPLPHSRLVALHIVVSLGKQSSCFSRRPLDSRLSPRGVPRCSNKFPSLLVLCSVTFPPFPCAVPNRRYVTPQNTPTPALRGEPHVSLYSRSSCLTFRAVPCLHVPSHPIPFVRSFGPYRCQRHPASQDPPALRGEQPVPRC